MITTQLLFSALFEQDESIANALSFIFGPARLISTIMDGKE